MKTLLIVRSAQARERMYLQAERDMTPSQAIVRVTDSISAECSTLTVPQDPRAEVVAREPPKLLPGGVTLLISYLILPFSSLMATEFRLEGTRVVNARTVLLVPERQGRGNGGIPA